MDILRLAGAVILSLTLLSSPAFAGVLVGEEDGDPDVFSTFCPMIKVANDNLTVNADTSCSIADQSGAGGGDPILVNTTAITDVAGVDLTDGAGITITLNAAVSPDTATFAADHDAANNFDANEHIDHTAVTLTAGAGLGGGGDISANRTFTTASGEADFLASGALTCGASTQGKAQVHTTPFQYCDNAATPALQYAAYGASDGDALAGDSATSFFDAGTLEVARGGTGAGTLNDLIALTTHTTGNYAAGNAEAGSALTGDSATSFFSSGTLEVAIGGTGTTTSTGTGSVVLGTTPTITLLDANGSAPTTDGAIEYDRTTESLEVGDGTNTRGFAPLAHGGTMTAGALEHKNLVIITPTTTTVDVDADYLTLRGTSNDIIFMAKDVNLTCTITTSGANGLEASDTKAATEWYEVHVIAKEDGTVACLLNDGGTAIGTMPTDYVYAQHWGWVKNHSNDLWDSIQRGLFWTHTEPGSNGTNILNTSSPATVLTEIAMETDEVIPPGVSWIVFRYNMSDTDANPNNKLNLSVDGTDSHSTTKIALQNEDERGISTFPVNTSGSIYYSASNNTNVSIVMTMLGAQLEIE